MFISGMNAKSMMLQPFRSIMTIKTTDSSVVLPSNCYLDWLKHCVWKKKRITDVNDLY